MSAIRYIMSTSNNNNHLAYFCMSHIDSYSVSYLNDPLYARPKAGGGSGVSVVPVYI